MPNALKFTIGGDASPFQGELKRMEEMAARAGQKVGQALSASSTVHVARENASAKQKYVSDYKTLLKQQEAAEVASAVNAAERSNRARMLRRQRAERDSKRMSEVNAAIAGGSIPESWQQASLLQQRQRGAAVKFGAGQMQVIHSLRATFDSLASGANPFTVMLQQIPQVTQGIAMMGGGLSAFMRTAVSTKVSVLGVLAAIATGAYVGYLHVKKLIDELAGVQIPDSVFDYIPKHMRGVNAIAEMWKKVGLEVANVADEYNNAAHAAERIAKTTSETYSHRRKLLEVEKETALALARTPLQKAAVENDFAKREQALNEKQRQAELQNMVNAKSNLEKEGREKAAQAAKILGDVKFSETHDAIQIANKKAQLDAADEMVKKLDAARNSDPFGRGVNMQDAFRAYNDLMQNYNPSFVGLRTVFHGEKVTSKDLEAADAKVRADRDEFRKGYESSVESKHANEVAREKAAQLAKASTDAFSKAATTSTDISQKQTDNETSRRNDAELVKAQEGLNLASAIKGQGASGFALNSTQKMGAYSATPPDQRQVIDLLKTIARNSARDRKYDGIGTKRPTFGGLHQ